MLAWSAERTRADEGISSCPFSHRSFKSLNDCLTYSSSGFIMLSNQSATLLYYIYVSVSVLFSDSREKANVLARWNSDRENYSLPGKKDRKPGVLTW